MTAQPKVETRRADTPIYVALQQPQALCNCKPCSRKPFLVALLDRARYLLPNRWLLTHPFDGKYIIVHARKVQDRQEHQIYSATRGCVARCYRPAAYHLMGRRWEKVVVVLVVEVGRKLGRPSRNPYNVFRVHVGEELTGDSLHFRNHGEIVGTDPDATNVLHRRAPLGRISTTKT